MRAGAYGPRTGAPGALALVVVGDPDVAAIAHLGAFGEPRLLPRTEDLPPPQRPSRGTGGRPSAIRSSFDAADASVFAESASFWYAS